MVDVESIAKAIAQAQTSLKKTQDDLDLLDVLKAKESQLKSDKIKYEKQIQDLQQQASDAVSEAQFMQKDSEVDPKELETKVQEYAKQMEKTPAEKRQAKMRAINKKLQQIDKLKLKDNLEPEAQKKVASEKSLKDKLAALERGEDVNSDDEAEPAPPAEKENGSAKAQEVQLEQGGEPLPSDPQERQKEIKKLEKKLKEIDQLKQKGGLLDKQAKEKRDSEQRIIQKVRALEQGKSTFVLDTVEEKAQQKLELEKTVKKLEKKLAQVEELKAKGGLDEEQQAKVDSEGALKKELHDVRQDVAAMNKEERERVAQRLGWEGEPEQKNGGKKKGGKK